MKAITHINPERLRPIVAKSAMTKDQLERPELIEWPILVKIYMRPQFTESGIEVPRRWRQDRSWTLYETVLPSTLVLNGLRIPCPRGSILKTLIGPPSDTGLYDEADDRRLFYLEPNRVQHIHSCTWEEEGNEPSNTGVDDERF